MRWLIFLLSVGFVSFAVAQAGRYDPEIQQGVEKALKSNPKFADVHATMEDSIVTLTGTVKLYRDRDKLDAQKKVRRVKHVEGVRNRVEIKEVRCFLFCAPLPSVYSTLGKGGPNDARIVA